LRQQVAESFNRLVVCLLTMPKTRAEGRKAIQDSAPTPAATPERTVEDTAS
jgi:hypothetical protein